MDDLGYVLLYSAVMFFGASLMARVNMDYSFLHIKISKKASKLLFQKELHEVPIESYIWQIINYIALLLGLMGYFTTFMNSGQGSVYYLFKILVLGQAIAGGMALIGAYKWSIRNDIKDVIIGSIIFIITILAAWYFVIKY